MNLINLIINQLAREKRSRETLDQYTRVLANFDTYLREAHDLSLDDRVIKMVTRDMLTQYYDSLANRKPELSINTLNNYATILKRFFKLMTDWKTIPDNVASDLPYIQRKHADEPPENPDELCYSDEEVERLLQHLAAARGMTAKRDLALILLILASGLRISEACRLNVKDFTSIKQGELVCRRKRGWQTVEFSGLANEQIERYLAVRAPCEEDDPLFVSNTGIRLTRYTAYKSIAKRQAKLKEKTGLHTYRRYFITQVAIQHGVAIARDAAGHESVSTTNRYISPERKVVRAAINATPALAGLKRSIGNE